MEAKTILKKKLRSILIQIKIFMRNSSMTYIEGSSKIVENGAYEWVGLDANQTLDQQDICNEYVEILNEVVHLKLDSSFLTQFNQSGERVLSFLRQDSIVWQKTGLQVYNEIEREIDHQLELSERL
ncbi:hypothetical protein [Saccharibacillus endophyticus]|uniref:Uncharacterized protein n=1 Tax=Saccharibacillus endophyticus TaxID=2060666 RepID=A0ABQ1ZLK9_9BACL|nr:hypothetical protein [Saccharibacillus endophyticus]GGH70851.1 hypothetical protein GCM10007362_07350 [Saccharibacillus endophyticus]